MRIYTTYEKQVKEIHLEEGEATVPVLRKQACEAFGLKEDEIIVRSGTRPVKDTFALKNDMNINIGKVKPPKEEIKEDDEEEYEYVYEEVTDDDEDYANESEDDDEDFESDDE